MRNTRLYCFSYAGASSYNVFAKWREYLDPAIELKCIDLPGKGRRMHEPFVSNWNEAIDDLYNVIEGEWNGMDYAFIGHSLGALVAFELCHKIQLENNIPNPIHAFFSGRNAPKLDSKDRNIADLPDEEFQEEIIRIGATPREIFENQSLRSIFTPIIREDMRLVENYLFNDRAKLKVPGTILLGESDEWTTQEDHGWQHQLEICETVLFAGNHFFINEFYPSIATIINKRLTDKCN